VINPPKILQTERLRLRKPKLSDAEVIFREYACDPEVTRFVSWRAHENVAETREFLRVCLVAWDVGRAFQWVIERKEDSQLIGMLAARVEIHRWELGYVLARRFWGNGYMTETVKGLIEWAFQRPEVFRVWAVCDIENVASARVMERAGMQREGVLRRWSVHPNVSADPRDSYCYSITK
jgi:RimJ/RimL family protein N-acetyltransferase